MMIDVTLRDVTFVHADTRLAVRDGILKLWSYLQATEGSASICVNEDTNPVG